MAQVLAPVPDDRSGSSATLEPLISPDHDPCDDAVVMSSASRGHGQSLTNYRVRTMVM